LSRKKGNDKKRIQALYLKIIDKVENNGNFYKKVINGIKEGKRV